MNNKQKAKKLYEGKKFYLMNPDGTIDGPRDDIFYASGFSKENHPDIAFAQVIDGIIRQVFTKKEILVLKNGKQVA